MLYEVITSQNLAAIKLLAEQELAGSGDARGTADSWAPTPVAWRRMPA